MEKKLFAIALVSLCVLASGQLAQQNSTQTGALVFSLKFSGAELQVQSITLVPGNAPSYRVQSKLPSLSVNFYSSGNLLRTIQVPDTREAFLELSEGGNLTGLHLYDQNASLIFSAPNLPSSDAAEILDENGSKLLSVDYRKGTYLSGTAQDLGAQAEFESKPSSGSLPFVAALLGIIAIALGYFATRSRQ